LARSAAGLRCRGTCSTATAPGSGSTSAESGCTPAAPGGKDKQQQATAQGTQIDGQVGKLGGERVEKPKPKPKNWLDQAADWLVDHTIGELGNVVGKQQLQQARSEWPDLNIAPGLQQIDDAKGRFLERHQQAVGRADAAAHKAIATLDGLVGTDKYGEVTAALRTLEDAMGQFDADEAASAEAYEADLDSIVEAYETLVKDSVTPQEIEVPGDPTDRHHPGD